MKRFDNLWFGTTCLVAVLVLFGFSVSGGKAYAKEKQVICLVSGMQMNAKDMKEKHAYKGKTYSFCSKGAKDEFSKNPEKYLKKTFVCPMDGMKMKMTDAADAVKYKGKMVYFCMKGEKETFLKSPEKYLKKESPKTSKKDHMEGMH